MTLPNSGSLSFTQIINEFGNRGSIGNYRVNQDIGGRNWTLDENFPTSGSVSFSTFRGKRRNIVVDCYSSGGSRVSAASRGKTTVGGGPTSTSGARVIIYVNNTFTSDSTQTRTRCALRTGTYGNSVSKVDIIMGNSGKIYGGGGNGGNGGNAGSENANAGNNGNPGTSALGLQRSVEEIVLSSGAVIRAGSGGGGGGGGAAGELDNSEEYGGGGGGAGGAGQPAGSGGSRGNSSGEVDDYGNNGNGGSTNNGGGGGEGATGGEEENNADGGGGGGGGSWGGTAGNGGEAGQGDGFDNGEAHDGNPGGYPGLSESGEENRPAIANGSGGGGGKGGARGSGQDEGQGGGGGASGYSICSNGGISINVSGGTVQGPTGAGQGVS